MARAINPVNSFLQGFSVVDQLETNRQMRSFREEEMSHTRKLWERQDQQYARDELSRLQKQDARALDAHVQSIAMEKADEYAGIVKLLEENPEDQQLIAAEREASRWITDATTLDGKNAGMTLVAEEAIRRMGASDAEAYERIALAGGLDPGAGSMIKTPTAPVTGISVIPPDSPMGDPNGTGEMVVEVNGMNGPAPYTDNRTDHPGDFVTRIKLDSSFYNKWLGPEMMDPTSTLNLSKFLQSQINRAEEGQPLKGPTTNPSAAAPAGSGGQSATPPETRQQTDGDYSGYPKSKNVGGTWVEIANPEEEKAFDAKYVERSGEYVERSGDADKPTSNEPGKPQGPIGGGDPTFDGPYAPAGKPEITPNQEMVDFMGPESAQQFATLVGDQFLQKGINMTNLLPENVQQEITKVKEFIGEVGNKISEVGGKFMSDSKAAYDVAYEEAAKHVNKYQEVTLDKVLYQAAKTPSQLRAAGVPASATASANKAFQDDEQATAATIAGAPIPPTDASARQAAGNLIAASNSPRKKPTLNEIIQTASFVKMGYIDMDQARRFVTTGSYDAPAMRKFEKVTTDGVTTWFDVTGDTSTPFAVSQVQTGDTGTGAYGIDDMKKERVEREAQLKPMFTNYKGEFDSQGFARFNDALEEIYAFYGLPPGDPRRANDVFLNQAYRGQSFVANFKEDDLQWGDNNFDTSLGDVKIPYTAGNVAIGTALSEAGITGQTRASYALRTYIETLKPGAGYTSDAELVDFVRRNEPKVQAMWREYQKLGGATLPSGKTITKGSGVGDWLFKGDMTEDKIREAYVRDVILWDQGG